MADANGSGVARRGWRLEGTGGQVAEERVRHARVNEFMDELSKDGGSAAAPAPSAAAAASAAASASVDVDFDDKVPEFQSQKRNPHKTHDETL